MRLIITLQANHVVFKLVEFLQLKFDLIFHEFISITNLTTFISRLLYNLLLVEIRIIFLLIIVIGVEVNLTFLLLLLSLLFYFRLNTR